MKKSYLAATAVCAFALILTGCGESAPDTPTTYALTLTAGEGSTITVDNPSEDGRYEAGDVVTFDVNVTVPNKVLDDVTFNGTELHSLSGTYTVTMPKSDSTIATTLLEIGPADLLDPVAVVDENVPETVQDVLDLLNGASVEANVNYLAEATLSGDFGRSPMGDTVQSYVYSSKVGRNGVALVEGSQFNGSRSLYVKNAFTVTDNYVYSLLGEQDSYGYNESASVGVLTDATEGLKPFEVNRDEADKQVMLNVGFTNFFVSNFFANSTSSFLNTNEEGWVETTLVTEVAENEYTATLSAKDVDYYGDFEALVELVLVVDGRNFIKNLTFTYSAYDEMDVNPDTNLPYEGATPEEVNTIEYVGTIDYRDEVEGLNVDDLVINGDYEVNLSYNLEGSYSSFDVVDGNIADSGEVTAEYHVLTAEKALVNPILVGSKEENKVIFTEDGTPVMNGLGETTLVFDNGAGELKEVKVNVVQPDPLDIEATLDTGDVVYIDELSTLTVSIIPEGANQNVNVEMDASSTGSVGITKVSSSTGTYFNLIGITEGEVTINYASVIKPSLSGTLEVTVMEKPDPAVIRSFLTTTTLHGAVSGWGDHFVNFNTDGTGEYVCYESPLKGDIVPFKWVLDEATLTVSLSDFDPDAKSRYYTIVGFSNVTETSIDFTFRYNGTSDRTTTMTALDAKLDFTTADLSQY